MISIVYSVVLKSKKMSKKNGGKKSSQYIEIGEFGTKIPKQIPVGASPIKRGTKITRKPGDGRGK